MLEYVTFGLAIIARNIAYTVLSVIDNKDSSNSSTENISSEDKGEWVVVSFLGAHPEELNSL